jgi:hypothetical protein
MLITLDRLAAAGCLHTAVALELSAGKARAADLTRKPERLTTPLPWRHLHPDRSAAPGADRVGGRPIGGAQPGKRHLPDARAMAQGPAPAPPPGTAPPSGAERRAKPT